MRIVTFGVFDLFHIGHLNLFLKIKNMFLNSDLIVAVQNTDSIIKYKPGSKVWYSFDDRKKIIEQLKCVSKVVAYDDVYETIQNLDFDIFVKGPDQSHDSFIKAVKWCKDHGKEVVVLPRTVGISSTAIKESIK